MLVLGVSLSGCVTTHVPTASTSPWQAEDLDTQANLLDVAFTDSRHTCGQQPDDPGNQRWVPIGMSAAWICPTRRTSA